MKIFIDFDRVAFDTDRLYELLNEVSIEPGTIESLDYLYPENGEPVEDLLFEDFKNFAAQQLQLGNKVIVITSATGFSGDWGMSYHAEKITRSGVGAFVSSVLPVAEGKVETLTNELEENEKGVFIDDSVQHLHDVSGLGYKKLTCLQMLRKVEMYTGEDVQEVEQESDFQIVHDFNEVATSLPKV